MTVTFFLGPTLIKSGSTFQKIDEWGFNQKVQGVCKAIVPFLLISLWFENGPLQTFPQRNIRKTTSMNNKEPSINFLMENSSSFLC